MTPTGRIWVVGPRPPPINGQSAYTAAMAKRLGESLDVVWLSTGGGLLSKLLKAVSNPWRLLVQSRPDDRFYLTPPGNLGLWLFLPTVVIVRARGRLVLIHHHSFRALNSPTPPWATRALVWIAGPVAQHIVLCRRMKRQFEERYRGVCGGLQTLTLSNAHLFGVTNVRPMAASADVIGHLSVLTREKGVDYLLEVFQALKRTRPSVRLVLAGPIPEDALRAQVERSVEAANGAIEYRGPVSGSTKEDFYRDISVFAFPTRLIDEADPLVLLESYAAGRDVVSTVTGCIEERLRSNDRILTLNLDDDVATLAQALDDAARNEATIAEACRTHAARLKKDADLEAIEFYSALELDRTRAVPA